MSRFVIVVLGVVDVDIDVDVENGVVTLSGKVKSDAEEDLVVTTAENVSDVKEVVNKLNKDNQ